MGHVVRNFKCKRATNQPPAHAPVFFMVGRKAALNVESAVGDVDVPSGPSATIVSFSMPYCVKNLHL